MNWGEGRKFCVCIICGGGLAQSAAETLEKTESERASPSANPATLWHSERQTQEEEAPMSTFGLIEYQDASPQVRAIYDDIMATRKADWINNFWKAIAHDPVLLKRTWESIKQIMAPGALDPLTKELIYIAVSVTNNCTYCI